MRTHLWISFTTLLLAIPAAAERAPVQDATPEAPATESAQQRCDALAAKAKAAHDAWIYAYQEEYQAAEKAGEDAPAFSWSDSPLGDFVPKFQASAKEYAGTDDAIPFLLWIATEVTSIKKDAAAEAIETLCASHIKSEALEPLWRSISDLQYIVGEKRSKELLTKIEKESSVPLLRGWATFTLHGDALEELEVGTAEYDKTKYRLLEAAKKADDGRLTAQIESKIRIRETFGLGMVAPDIDGIDLDGAAFKLSDYEGKILFVDFWGDW